MAALLAAIAAGCAWAATETVGGCTWTYRINGDTAEIYGPASYPVRPVISPKPTGTVTIPSTLGGKPVTRIGAYAFYNCSGLTSVTIPDSVTSIGSSAFYNCKNVTDVVVPGWSCNIPFGAVTNLVISEGATSIRDRAFSGCSGLTDVTIPDGVTSIGSHAFCGCSGLTSVAIPNSVLMPEVLH